MLRTLFQMLCVVATLSLGGVQYVVGRTVAWVDMLVSNAARESFSRAVAHTFDGAHPCSRCLTMQQASEREQELPSQKALKEFKVFTATSFAFPRFVFDAGSMTSQIPPERAAVAMDGHRMGIHRPPEIA